MPKFENIGEWVEKKYGSQAKAAKALGTAQGVISQWVTERSAPSDEKWALIVKSGYDGPRPGGKNKSESPEQGRVTGALPEHIADAYQIIFEAIQAARSDLMAIDPKKAGLVIGLVAQEVAKGGKEEVRTTLVRRAEVLLGLG